ncbi:MAG: DNA polymerase ligase N-terminal domain-containing protein [Planctomycetota bacterium]
MAAERRFVILTHDHPSLHWVLMLEDTGTLRTWRLPSPLATGAIDAKELPDHRLAYLDYEGPVSGNRGTVQRFDAGSYQIAAQTNDRLELILDGGSLRGHLLLERTAGADWRLTWTVES